MIRRSIKNSVKNCLKHFGYEITRTKPAWQWPELIDFLRARNVDLIFDVGANEGQFGLWMRQLGYRGRLVSFEPIGELFAVLKTRADEDGNWEAHPIALGARRGKAAINVSEVTVYSSLLGYRDALTTFDPSAARARTEDIAVATLDEFAPRYAGSTAFLKSDTQGSEREVLLGAKATLSTLEGVQLELPIIHFYAGVWTIAETIDFMAQQGFVIAQVHPVNCHPADPVSWVEADCVFRRADPRMD
jgi:FkbM family methyltransferase